MLPSPAKTRVSPEAALLFVRTKSGNLWDQLLARRNTGSLQIHNFPLLCTCSKSSLANLIYTVMQHIMVGRPS